MKNAKAYLFIVIAMLIWGFSFVWSKALLNYLPPLALVSLRYLLASLFSIFFLIVNKKLFRIQKKHIFLFIVLAFLEPFLYSFCEIFGIKLTSSAFTAIIISTIPITVAIANYFIHNERLMAINIFGIILSFLGIIIIIVDKDFVLYASYSGIVFLFGAVLVATISGFILKKLSEEYSIPTIISYQNIISAFMFFPFIIYYFNSIISIEVNTESMVSLFSLAFFASIVAFSLYTYGITKIGLTKTMVFTNLIPIFTGIFAYFYFDELVTIQKAVGILIVISGLYLFQKQKRNFILPFTS